MNDKIEELDMEENGMAENGKAVNDLEDHNIKEKSIEEVFQLLDGTVEKLESREISLEESFGLYKQGMELLKYCNEKIDTVEKKMQQINENGELNDF